MGLKLVLPLSQSRPGSNGNEGVSFIPQSHLRLMTDPIIAYIHMCMCVCKDYVDVRAIALGDWSYDCIYIYIYIYIYMERDRERRYVGKKYVLRIKEKVVYSNNAVVKKNQIVFFNVMWVVTIYSQVMNQFM